MRKLWCVTNFNVISNIFRIEVVRKNLSSYLGKSDAMDGKWRDMKVE